MQPPISNLTLSKSKKNIINIIFEDNKLSDLWEFEHISSRKFDSITNQIVVKIINAYTSIDVIMIIGWSRFSPDPLSYLERFQASKVLIQNGRPEPQNYDDIGNLPVFFDENYQLINDHGIATEIKENSLILNTCLYKPTNGKNECSTVTFNPERNTYQVGKNIGSINKVVFISAINDNTFELIPFFDIFPSFNSFLNFEENFDIDSESISNILIKYNNENLSKLNTIFTDSHDASDLINIYPHPLTFHLSDTTAIYHPITFCYCIGNHSPLRSSKFKNFTFRNVSSQSMNFLMKCFFTQRFPRFADFSKHNSLFIDLHYIADMLNQLDIIYYTDLFIELSKEVDYQYDMD
jgi:hypothetical protein